MKRKHLLIVSDNIFVYELIKYYVEFDKGIKVIGCAVTAVDAIRKSIDARPDVVLLYDKVTDMKMTQLSVQLKKRCVGVKTIIICDETESLTHDIVSKKATDFSLTFKNAAAMLIKTIKDERNNRRSNTAEKTPAIDSEREESESDSVKMLTDRELTVLYLISKGYSNKEIAKRMILSEFTVKNHVSHILKKLSVSDRAQAAVFAWENGLAGKYDEFGKL